MKLPTSPWRQTLFDVKNQHCIAIGVGLRQLEQIGPEIGVWLEGYTQDLNPGDQSPRPAQNQPLPAISWTQVHYFCVQT